MGKTREACSIDCLKYIEWLFEHLVTPQEVACIIVEPVLGEGGYVVPPIEYMKGLRELTADHEILLIADEVQTGFGRTGRWFACEHFQIEPDIIVLAKAIAAGMPLSAIGARRQLMERWQPGAHGTTFGGNPLSASAALASISVIEREGLVENAAAIGTYALERLKALKEDHPAIGDVRGLGLMIGVELVNRDGSPAPELLKRLLEGCLQRGLIIVECGTHKNVARLMPPLITTRQQMERALQIFEEALMASL